MITEDSSSDRLPKTVTQKTNAQGAFEFVRFEPGSARLVVLAPGYAPQCVTLEIQPGFGRPTVQNATGACLIGASNQFGRPAGGAGPSQNDLEWDNAAGSHYYGCRRTITLIKQNRNRTREQSLEWQKSPEMREAYKNDRSYGWCFDDNGSFRIDNVAPGTYRLSIVLSEPGPQNHPTGQIIGQYSQEFTVLEVPGGVSDEPLDLGTLTIHVASQF